MCWSIERWGGLEEIRKHLESERQASKATEAAQDTDAEAAVRELLESVPDLAGRPGVRIPG